MNLIKEFAKYMVFGKMIENPSTGDVYKLVESVQESMDCVKAVHLDNWQRYHLLNAWIRNWEQNSIGFRERFTGNIEECKVERKGYEEDLKIADFVPYDTIRFITPNYQTKFEVKDLSVISVNGTLARVVYLDECHFTFVDKIATRLYGGCFHICQFAEICEREGIEVKPV